jgi:hypothetical protein
VLKKLLIILALLLCVPMSLGATWSGILPAGEGIDWQNVGVPGGIPARPTICTNLTATATAAQINSALAACPSGQTVKLAPGTYTINANINEVSNVTLRGSGARQTILNITAGSGYAINFGSGSPSAGSAVNVTSGATQGSTSLVLSSTSGVSVGSYLLVSELNNSGFVTPVGSEGNCGWCGGVLPSTRLRGEIVEVSAVSGTNVTLTLPLVAGYTLSPQAIPFAASVKYAGLEDLQVYANNTGHNAAEGMSRCAYCWVKGVENNMTDGDHMDVDYSYGVQIESNYFTGSYVHAPGSYDSDVDIRTKTSRFLVVNNIVERGHVSIMTEWGAAGGVVAYNYAQGAFDSSVTNFTEMTYNTHGAHEQFILFEANIGPMFQWDNIWGSNSDITCFRCWGYGPSLIATPYTGRGTINWAGAHQSYQSVRDFVIDYEDLRFNMVGNVSGSTAQAALGLSHVNTLVASASANRSYDTVDYGWNWGCGEASDPCKLGGGADSTAPFSTAFITGNYNFSDNSTTWKSGVIVLPSSFYLSAKPTWWNSRPFPNIGPDITGGTDAGGHVYPNPAMDCYTSTVKATDNSLQFDRATCYGGTAVSVPNPPTNLTATPQ